MANNSKPAVNSANEKIEITLPFIPGMLEDDVFVSVNCKNYLIQRGKSVKIPRYVAEVIENSNIATIEAFEYISKSKSKN